MKLNRIFALHFFLQTTYTKRAHGVKWRLTDVDAT